MQDCIAKGRKNAPRGEAHYRSVLKLSDVAEIRTRLSANEAVVSISKDFPQVTIWAVYDIKQGTNWRQDDGIRSA